MKVWTDRKGVLVFKSSTATEVRPQAALGGVLVGLSAAAAVLLGGGVGRGCLERQRMAESDAEWLRVGPQWRKRMIG
ncbi:hypothetical protein [Streptomyces sp. NPDC050564]|uniref:hypothetical protein n=1 Tax=Streptomyces sp. NPDC050564 TaxID=3365631 RepID=UPI0037B96414